MVEEGVTAKAADEEEEAEGGAAEAGRRRVERGPELSHRKGRREAESFTVRPDESNSIEQELSAVN